MDATIDYGVQKHTFAVQTAGPAGPPDSMGRNKSPREVAKAAGVLRSQGRSASEAKAAGFTIVHMALAGYSAAELREIESNALTLRVCCDYTAFDMLFAGFTPRELLKAKYTLSDLIEAGLRAEEFQADDIGIDMLRASGITLRQLVGAGFSPQALSAHYSEDELWLGYCPIELLPTSSEVGAARLPLVSKVGIPAKALRNVGWTAAHLRDAGYTASDAIRAGYNAEEVLTAGFPAAQLLLAYYKVSDLKRAGYNARQVIEAGAGRSSIKSTYSVEEIRNSGLLHMVYLV